ncbi:MAG: ribosome maturation factor RimM [Acetobacteraceae bacterium]
MAGRRILLATIGRPHGTSGLVHVTCYAADPASLARYRPLEDEAGRQYRLSWAKEGIARLSILSSSQDQPIRDRTAAAGLVNRKLFVARSSLPPTNPEEFYLADLIGLAAFDAAGESLGVVSAVHDYGAGASLEIGPLMIPFTRAAVPEVDLGAGRITVAPPPEIETR